MTNEKTLNEDSLKRYAHFLVKHDEGPRSAGGLVHESGWANEATVLGSAAAGVVQRNTAGAQARPSTPG